MTTAVLPDVVIGGAPRSGTTFLCEVLAKHPRVFVARPFIPEPKVLMTVHPEGDPGYVARYRQYFGVAPRGSVRVEKTSYYFENQEARERFVRILPNSRMIFILREPVARAYSNWLWSTRNGLETLPFAEAVQHEGSRSSPLPPEKAYARPFDYLARAQYATFAELWIQAIGRERVAFYVFEDFLAEPAPFVDHLQQFIGVEPLAWEVLRTGVVNANELGGEEIDSGLTAHLKARLAPEMRRFADLTGCSITSWGY